SAEPSACSRASALAGATSAPMIWPPSNAISIRTRSELLTRYDLRQDAVERIGMDECDLEPEEAFTRRLVDQVRACARRPGERCRQVRDLERHVVHPGTALREKPADGSVGVQRLQELDAALPDPQRHGADPLPLNR